jgi:hypothetical protein
VQVFVKKAPVVLIWYKQEILDDREYWLGKFNTTVELELRGVVLKAVLEPVAVLVRS